MICRKQKTKSKNHPWRKKALFANAYMVREPVPILDDDLDMLPIMSDEAVIDMQVKENSY